MLEDLGYFIADYSRVDYYNYLRNDLVARTGAAITKPMNIPITTTAPANDAEIATLNTGCL